MNLENIRSKDIYEVIEEEPLPDIHAEGVLLRHKKSGARVVLIPCADENKVFNIAFRTPPKDSTGVAHIIEHTVLCGSEHFPLKDPFVELVKGSLNTFLNAMTYPDKTMYPVASTNDTDFRNLMHVYLDAVFHPNIYHEQNIFRQEGWHYELNDPSDDLKVNGVVFNEMKGVYSSPDDVLERETMDALFPDTIYGVESGGDPDVIPSLTYENYLNFHRTYYHPSNSYIYLYGNMDMDDTLDFIDREYLSGYDVLDVDSAIGQQKPFESEHILKKDYPVSDDEDMDKKAFLSWNVVAGNPNDIKELIAFDVLDYALLSAPGAPVRQALLDAGIGQDVYGSFNDGILQPYFSVVSKNASASDADRFEEIIRRVLREQADRGIERKSLVAGLNFMEFQFREADYGQYPKGLMYAMDVMDSWLYDDAKPFENLKQLQAYAELQKEVDSGYFENLIREKLLDNTHAALVVLTPKKGLQEEREAKRAEKLAAKKAAMSAEEIDRIVSETKALLAWQDTPDSPEALASLPMLKRSDIRKEAAQLTNIPGVVRVPLEAREEGHPAREVKIPAVFHEADTNGIGYTELFFDVKHVAEEDLPYLGLLKAVLFNIDTDTMSYMSLNNRINAETGGIAAGLSVLDDPKDPEGYQAYFTIRMKALYAKNTVGFEIIREVLKTSHFADEKRLREIFAQGVTQLQMSIQQMGHTAAALRAGAYGSSLQAFSDRTGGIEFYKFIRGLASDPEAASKTGKKLRKLTDELMNANLLLISYTAEKKALGEFAEYFRRGFGAIPGAEITSPAVKVKPYGKLNEGFMTPGQVQFVAMAGNFAREGIPYTGSMQVYRQIMSYEYLWQNVRVRGGAYGCGAVLKRGGSGTFTSFRDPHLERTKNIYLGVPEYLENFEADEEEMTKYVIGTVSGLDTPLTPAMLGSTSMRAYLTGTTQEMIQKTRDEVLSATEEDIRKVAPAAKAVLDENNFCVVGSEAMIRKHQDLFGRIEQLI